MNPTSGPMDMSIAKKCVYWVAEAPDEVLQRYFLSMKCTSEVAISKYGIIEQSQTRRQSLSQRNISLMCWTSHLEHVTVWIEMYNGSNKMGQLYIQPTSCWSGLTIDSLIGWSSGAANPIGLCIHTIWTLGFLEGQRKWEQSTIYCSIQSGHQSEDSCHTEKKCDSVIDNFARRICVISAMAVIWNTSCQKMHPLS